MASFMERQGPRESPVPRRKTPTRQESRTRSGLGAPAADGRQTSYGSDAASRHDLFVPVAYPVAERVAEAHAVTEPSAPGRDNADTESYLSSDREPETSVLDEAAFGTETSYMTEDYSEYSRVLDSDAGAGGGAGGDRFVGSRDWARHHQDSNPSHVTMSSSENPWSGPGRQDSDDPPRRAADHDDRRHGGGAGVRRGGAVMHDLPPYPYTQQTSVRSGMSHDLEGFSDFDPVVNDASLSSITDAHPPASDPQHLARIAGTGAAAAAAAEATNAAAKREKEERAERAARQAREARVTVSTKGSKRPTPPVPHGVGRDETKEDTLGASAGGMSAFRASTLEAARTVGDPYDERPRNANGTTGEYAVPTYYKVIFTPLVFTLCGILLLWEFALNDWGAESLATNPSFGPSVETLIEAGAKRTDLIVENGDWWRIISPMFLHAGILHFMLNMLGFLQIGAMVERVFGWWRIAAIYLVAGVYGTIVSAIFVPSQVMVGASGAIFGVFGALWADLWQNWSVYQDKCRTLTVLGVLTVVNLLIGAMPYLDNFAHLGGMIMGLFMGLGLLVQKREDDLGDQLSKKCYQRTLQLVAAVAVPVLMILGLSLLYGRSDPSEWCGWCENISCVEFPPGDNPWWACDECSTVGFTAEAFDNGTIFITCPDGDVKSSTTCSAATDDTLTECCIDLCL